MENNPAIKWAQTHPRLSAWIVLATGMVAMLLYFGRDVGLTAFNWVALIIATVVTAGLCIWIISWEDEEESSDENTPASEGDAN